MTTITCGATREKITSRSASFSWFLMFDPLARTARINAEWFISH